MRNHVRRIVIGAAVLASSAVPAFARTPLGTDPEPGVVHHLIHALMHFIGF